MDERELFYEAKGIFDQLMKLSESMSRGKNQVNTNERVIVHAYRIKNIPLMKLYLDCFNAGFSSLYNASQMVLYQLPARHMDHLTPTVTPLVVKRYESVFRVIDRYKVGNNGGDDEGVCIAAALSDESDLMLLATLIDERQPRDADEMTELMKSASGVPRNLSSGIL